MVAAAGTSFDPSVAPPANAKELGRRYAPNRPRAKVFKRLYKLLTAKVGDDEWARAEWLEHFGQWMHDGGEVPLPDGASLQADPRIARLQLLVRVLRDIPDWRRQFASVLGPIVTRAQSVRLFSDSGLPVEPGFVRELFERIAFHVLPSVGEPSKLAELLRRALPTPADARWLRDAQREVLVDVVRLMFEDERQEADALRMLRVGMIEAVSIITARICGLGLSQDICDRLEAGSVPANPFVRLVRACDALALDPRGRGSTASDLALASARQVIDECRAGVSHVLDKLENAGVSLDLVYRLELIVGQLSRLEDLIVLLVPGFTSDRPVDLAGFMASLVDASFQGQSIRALIGQNSGRLARKIIERTGHSGEHYITSSRGEWFKMLASAMGGGMLTTGTAALKFVIAKFRLAPFFSGLAASVNYAGSFVLMQALGFTLATKQPSMTAAALARALEDQGAPRSMQGAGARGIDRLVDMIARIARSQFAAALGNIGMVAPVALLLDWYSRRRTGHHFLDHHQAEHVIESMHLYRSGTIAYAALTGVLLWMASVAAGWIDNWAVYNRIPEAIERNRRLIRWFGPKFAKRASVTFSHSITGVGGSVALGFLLGMTPIAGAFFGIPLDVRHVTLSTGALTLAGAAVGTHEITHAPYLWAAGGVLLIGLMNFGVSFVLALSVALRARDVPLRDAGLLLHRLRVRFFRSPLSFFFPPRYAPPEASLSIPPPAMPPGGH